MGIPRGFRLFTYLKDSSSIIKMEKMLSTDDIVKIISYYNPSCLLKVYTYPDLLKYKDIYKLLPNSNNFCIVLLYPWSVDNSNIGHWVCITGKKDSLTYFDSYGMEIDNNVLKEYRNKLIKLLLQYKGKMYYNEYPLQKLEPGINTCGRWVSIFGSFHRTNTVDQFAEIIYQGSNIMNISPDELSVKLTQN